jgi:hypothetical protein
MTDMAGGRGLGLDGALVIEFTPTFPANPAAGPFPTGQIAATDYPANSWASMTVALSTKPCDFTPPDSVGHPAAAFGTQSTTVIYTVGPAQVNFTGRANAVSLTPGVTYYANIATRQFTGSSYSSSCFGTVCELRVTPFKPAGH